MKTKKVMSSAFLGAVAMAASMSVYAFNDGHLDGVWFKTEIRTTVKPNHSIYGGGPVTGPSGYLNSSEIKFDSGKNSCYSTLTWAGDLIFRYGLHNFCKRSGKWEYVSHVVLEELGKIGAGRASGSVGKSNLTGSSFSNEHNLRYISFVLPAKGKSIHDRNSKVAMYVGTLILKPDLDKAGNIKEVKLVHPQDGTILYSDFEPLDPPESGGFGYTGTAPSGLSMKQVNPRWIPKGAKACLDSVLGVGPAIHHCESLRPPE